MKFPKKKKKEQTEGKKKLRSKIYDHMPTFIQRTLRKTPFRALENNRFFQALEKYSLIAHAVLAMVLIFVIEWVSRMSFTSAASFVIDTPLRFLFNALIIYVTLLFAYLFRHRGLVRIIISVFWLLLGVVNGFILASRVTPFNFTDLKLIGDLLSMQGSKYFSVWQGVLVVICLALLLIFLIVYAVRGPFYKKKIHRFRNLILLIVAVICLPFIAKGAIHTGIMASYFGNLAQGYADYGFVYSFVASTVDTGMSEPKGYSESSVNTLLEQIDVGETTLDSEDMPNIIFVQLESFIDPTEVNFLTVSQDPIPNFRNLMKNYTSGHLTVPIVGAGTANTEFELLTGMALRYFGLGEYPYKTVLKDTTCESAAGVLSDLGYGTHAIHNNGGNFYGRANVFANMGFDSFTSKELMNATKYNILNSWLEDDILIEETLKVLDSTENQSDFVFTIAVQSHGNYPTYEVYEDPVIEVTGAETEEKNYQWEYFANQMYEVDQVVGRMIEELSKREEKTLVVFYGDHLPTMGLSGADMATGDLYKTTYATWNNFGLEKADKDLTTYQIMAYMMDQLGIHEGTIFTYQQECLENEALAANASTDLETLQYDLLYGERYAYKGQDLYPRSDLIMGVQEVVIEGDYIDYEGTKLNIIGKNFTPWSKVFVNGERVTTSYQSGTRLLIFLKDVNDGDTIVVNQLGAGETIFRSSNEYIWHEPYGFDASDEENAENVDDDELVDTQEDVVNTVTDEDEEAHDAGDSLQEQVKDALIDADEDVMND
ncbi:MAG: sulfatase-like hydrolase/transferase [Eubacterium sp.]|nr:sulfatase-like hydrolase/transferase [Eubacterium sp.]